MKQTMRQLEYWVSTNQIDQVLTFFLDALTDFRSESPSHAEEVKDLRMDILSLSSRYHDWKSKSQKGTMPKADIEMEKRAITHAILHKIGDLPVYQHFSAFLEDQEEEKAWQKATDANSIFAYQAYFNQYPDGKYSDETARIIEELKSIQEDQAKKMKAAAEQERNRREQQEAFRRSEPRAAGFSGAFDSSGASFREESRPGHEKSIDGGLAVLLYVASAIIPIIGLGYGGYLHFAKEENGRFKYDDSSRKKARIMMILGGLFFLIYMSGGM